MFTGSRARHELRDFYRAADVFVTTPWYEPFGITPIEAMACGTPVIGAAVGGIKFTVRHHETGFLVPPRDPDTLARRLKQVLGDPKLQRRLGANAIRRARANFTWCQISNDIAALYEDTCAPQRAAPAQLLDCSRATAERCPS